tara:strand:+ start:299 stop:760 length:462 start_codon:yes stop_codon:yes gene_type:complete
MAFAECVEGDCVNGKGKYNSSGHIYIGDFKDGAFHGYGQYIWTDDGTFYEGEFIKNMFHGQGRITFPDGSYEEGYYEDDELVSTASAKTYWEGALNCYRYTDNPIKESQRPYIDQLTLEIGYYESDPYSWEDSIIMLSTMIVDNLGCSRDVFR